MRREVRGAFVSSARSSQPGECFVRQSQFVGFNWRTIQERHHFKEAWARSLSAPLLSWLLPLDLHIFWKLVKLVKMAMDQVVRDIEDPMEEEENDVSPGLFFAAQ